MKNLHPDPPYAKPSPYPENRFKPLTSNCDAMPTLFFDTPSAAVCAERHGRLPDRSRYPSAEKPQHARFD